jgi:hypothetical protein
MYAKIFRMVLHMPCSLFFVTAVGLCVKQCPPWEATVPSDSQGVPASIEADGLMQCSDESAFYEVTFLKQSDYTYNHAKN